MTLDQHDGPLTGKRKLLDGPIAIELNRVNKRQAFKHVNDIALFIGDPRTMMAAMVAQQSCTPADSSKCQLLEL